MTSPKLKRRLLSLNLPSIAFRSPASSYANRRCSSSSDFLYRHPKIRLSPHSAVFCSHTSSFVGRKDKQWYQDTGAGRSLRMAVESRCIAETSLRSHETYCSCFRKGGTNLLFCWTTVATEAMVVFMGFFAVVARFCLSALGLMCVHHFFKLPTCFM
jgi:hypothetical protein